MRGLGERRNDGVRDALTGHPLTVAVPEDLPPIRADFALTEHALANLLLNAALHTPAGTPIRISAGLSADGRQAFFTVADRGPGLPAPLRARLFQKFSRGETAGAGGLASAFDRARLSRRPGRRNHRRRKSRRRRHVFHLPPHSAPNLIPKNDGRHPTPCAGGG